MNIKKIPKEAQTIISASANINNYTRAIEELIYNSLDAECTSIAIRVSIQESFIQILDNGIGINKENFCLLGQKYATSKHIDVTMLKSAPDKYGFRGISLASIIEISQDVLISSRYHKSDETWLKSFYNGTKREFCVAPARPSKGTTVEIRGFLYNLNIQRKSIDNLHELQKIKSSLEQLSLIHCNVSISLRDDYKNEIIFKIHKKRNIYQTLSSLFEISREDVQELQVEKNQYKVKAFISKNNVVKQNQWIYLNGKFVSKTDIHKKVNKVFNKFLFKHNKITKIKNKNNDDYSKSDLPFYFIFISCPFYDFDVIYKNKQTLVEFKDWTEIDKLIEKLIQFYCGESNLRIIPSNNFRKEKENKIENKIENTRIQVKQIIEKILNNNDKQSSLQRGIKGKNIKRKNKKNHKQIDNDIPLKTQEPKINLTVLDLKKKQDVQNIIKKFDAKKEIMKPTLKDIKKIKHNKTSSKQIKKIKNVNGLINKFKNQTESVKKRCAKLSSEAQYMMNFAPNNKIIKFKYTTEYNGTLSYSNNKEVALDTDYVNTETKYIDYNFKNNNFDFIKPKTSYDLIKPFNQSDSECPTTPKHTERQCSQISSHSEAYESLHPKNTFDSHNCHNNSERMKKIKHFISTSSRQNFSLQNKNYIISNENYHRTKENLLNEINVRNNVNVKQVSDEINENGCDQTTEVNNYEDCTHNYEDCDNYVDKINISDLDNQSLIKSDFGKTYDIEESSVENAQNKTYSVFNNLSENNSFQLSSIDKEPFIIEQSMEHVQRYTKLPIVESPSNVEYILSKSIDPLSYCEIIFKSNEMDDIEQEFINSFTSNQEKNDSFDYELIDDDNNNEILEANLTESTKDKECGIKEKKLTLYDIKIAKLKTVPQNNLPQDLNNFQLKKRHEFMPKGMSQIYNTRIRKKCDLSSTNIDYYENIVYNNFADDVLVNSEIFSPMLENIDVKSKKFDKTNHKDDSNLIFKASCLKEAKVFGQIDRKFIATQIKGISSDSSLDFLVLFDQHAVDERIRLETNLADYFDGNKWRGVALDAVPLKLDKNDLQYLYNHKLKFIQFGLQWNFLDDKILVHSIPKAILGKNPRQEDVVLKAVRSLILEEIDVIKALGGNVTLYPKAIMDLVFSEACRYAIKFGDKLSKSDCVALLEMLSTCKTPFQCAHGRPVMAVLIDLPRSIRNYKVNVENIKQFKIRKSI